MHIYGNTYYLQVVDKLFCNTDCTISNCDCTGWEKGQKIVGRIYKSERNYILHHKCIYII